MKHKTLLSLSLIFGLLLASGASAGQVHGSPLLAPVGTNFTYQGRLIDSSKPANGIYDFTFTLYDDLSSGAQVGSTLTRSPVTVTDGQFTVQLDFGPVFDGTALYLEIGVRPSGGGAYTPLAPRQALTAAPYAHYAAQSPWSGLVGIPSGFADGVDDVSSYTAGTGMLLNAAEFSILDSYRLPQTCASGQVPQWNGSTWACASQTAYSAGTGLDLSGGQFGLLSTYQLPQGCTNGQVSQWNGSAWVCANVSSSTYTAGPGIDVSGSVISAVYGGSGGAYGAASTLARSDHTHTNFIGIGDAAGGDLTGPYPNPNIATNAVGSAEIIDGSIDMADTRNWMGFDTGSAAFVGGSGNSPISIWGSSFTPSASGVCMVIINGLITSTGTANDDPQPALETIMDQNGAVLSDPYFNIPFSPQDVDSNEDLTATITYIWTVNSGQATRFGCRVTDPDGDWDTDETVSCRISYICQ